MADILTAKAFPFDPHRPVQVENGRCFKNEKYHDVNHYYKQCGDYVLHVAIDIYGFHLVNALYPYYLDQYELEYVEIMEPEFRDQLELALTSFYR